MALPATDSFTGTNGTGLTTYSASWTYNYGSGTHLQIQSNGLFCSRASDAATARWNADTFNADQYAQVTMAAVGNGGYYGPAVRISTSGADTCYYIEVDSSDGSYLFKTVAGSGTQLGSTAGTAANADVWRLEANGTTITPKKNGSTTGTPGAQTDSSISSGAAGLHAWGTATGSRMDDWSGGNLGAATQTVNPNAISSGATVYQPAITVGAVTVSVNAISSGASVYQPAVTSGRTIAPNAISSTASVYQPTVTPGAVTVALNVISSTASVYQPAVSTSGSPQTVNPNAIASTATVRQPTVTPGAVTVAASAISSGASVAAPYVLYNACVNGVLRVNATNGRYFENDNGILALSGTWWWHTVQDGQASDPPAATDWDAYIAYTVARGGNLIKHSMQESPRNWPDVAPYYYAPLPWARTGPGTAADGKAKFDLTSWDSTYFSRLRARTVDAGNKGMYVVIQLAQGWQIDNKSLGSGNPWSYHPMHPSNNINSVDGDLNDDGVGNDTRDSSNTTIFNHWKALFRQMYATVGDLDNVLWEISNEDGTYSRQWQWDFIDYIHTYEASQGKEHPAGMTWIYPGGSNSTDLYASPADWISYGANDTTPLSNPVAWFDTGATQVSVWDTDHMGGISYDPTFVWRAFTRGHNPLWMDKYDGTLYGGDIRSDATSEEIRYNMGYVQDYAARINLATATPQGSLASTGYCLANTTQLLAYQPGSGNFTVNLTTFSGTYSVEFLRVSNGATTTGSNVSGGATRTMTAPWAGEDFVAFLEKLGDEIFPNAISSGATVYQPAITVGAVTVSVNAISSGASVYQPAVTVGAVTVNPNAIGSTAQVHQPVITSGGFVVQPNAISSTASVHQPAVTAGAVTVSPNAISSGAQVYPPTVAQTGVTIYPAAITSSAQLYPPAITVGAVTISLNAISSAATVYGPNVYQGSAQMVFAGAITSTAQVFTVAITAIVAGRIYRVSGEDRTWAIDAEDRTYSIGD